MSEPESYFLNSPVDTLKFPSTVKKQGLATPEVVLPKNFIAPWSVSSHASSQLSASRLYIKILGPTFDVPTESSYRHK